MSLAFSWFKKAPKHSYVIIKCSLTIYMLHDFFSKKLTPEPPNDLID